MWFSILIAASVQTPFVLVDRKDPMTDVRQIAYMASNDEGTMAIACPSPGEMSIRFIPERYYGPGQRAIFWEPNASYRFGSEKVSNEKWIFGPESLELGDLLGSNSAKARFIDRLSRNQVLHIRYEARIGEVKTWSFLYSTSVDQLRTVLSTCNPKRVRAELRKMKSALETGGPDS